MNTLVIRNVEQVTEGLEDLRRKIDELDNQLLTLLAKRMEISEEIGRYKKEKGMLILQSARYGEILNSVYIRHMPWA